jgi:hypothetical protein
VTERRRVGLAGCGFIGRKEGGGSPRAAADLAVFLLSGDARGISGKLISAQWDDWRDPELRARLAGDSGLATVRRIDGERYRRVT